jgi:hypothetical protein
MSMATQNPVTPPLQTGKGRASRIPLNYFKTLNGLERAKLLLTVVALVAAGAWVAWGAFVQRTGGEMRYSRGPVALVHAANEADCQSCHVPFSPISEQNLFMKHPSTADGHCQTCHPTLSGDDHHKNMKTELVPSCAGCHSEHQGRDFSLVRAPDRDCTVCHKDLKGHVKSGESTAFANAVISFAAHPEFGAYSKGLRSPGNLQFNHKLHLMPGQGSKYTLEKVRREDPAAYGRFVAAQTEKSDGALVQLECASCHVLKPAGHGASATTGRYMQHVTYEVNCKACHPLTFDSAVKDGDGRTFALPHGKPWAETEHLLEFEYLRAVRRDPAAFRGPKAPRPLPGKSLDEVIEKLDPGAEQELARTKAASATRYLEGKAGCGECHVFAGDRIVPVNVPDVWFPHSKFSHAAHSTMKCADCHAGVTDSTVNTGALPRNVMPDVKSCQSCHGPAKSEGGKQVGGVRSECVTCHSYHHGDKHEAALGMRGRELDLAADLRRLLRR